MWRARRGSVSPTFVLIGEYQGRRTIYHFDVYRLRDGDEFEQLGPEEYFDAGGLTLIEWADRVADWLPEDRFEITVTITGPTSRSFAIGSPSAACATSAAACEPAPADSRPLAQVVRATTG